MNQRVRKRRVPDIFDGDSGYTDRLVTHLTSSKSSAVLSDVRTEGRLTPLASSLRGQEVTLDENHIKKLGGLYDSFQFRGDVGGEFTLTRRGIISEYQSNYLLTGEGINSGSSKYERHEYRGPVYAKDPRTLAVPSDPSLRDLGPLGTHAIAAVKPTNNVADLAVDLAEARRDGLPALYGAHLWKGRTHLARSAGGEYLNSEFGWKPLVSDIRDAGYAAANAHKILASYERNSHKLVRRRFDFPVEKTIDPPQLVFHQFLGYIPGPSINWLTEAGVPRGDLYSQRRFYRKAWFSGAFTYHLPIGYSSRNGLISAAAKAGPLLGIELTPEVVWSATPWTWALDWMSNIGDIVSIMSDMSNDGLVIQYGYMMEHTVTSWTYTLSPTGYRDGSRDACIPLTYFVETKRRKRATPFGFEIGWEGLTLRQLAISAALGLTRWL